MRFKGFEGRWERKKLGDIGEIVSGLTYSPSDINENGVLVLRSSNIQNRTLTFNDNVFVKTNNFNAVLENDILICVRNGSKNLIGKNAVIKKNQEGYAFGAFMTVYRSLYNKFLFHWFDTEKYKEAVYKNLGATINSINGSDLKKFEVPFPCTEEQQKIASFLSLLDERINTQNKIIEKLKSLIKILSEKLFTLELRFKDENGNKFPEWEEKKLVEVAQINPKTSSLPPSFIYIDLESVVDGVLLKEERIEKGIAPSRAQRVLKTGDILFQMVRPYQKNNLYFNKEGQYVASTGYAQIRTKNNSQFIFQYLHYQKFVDKVLEKCTGTSYPAINSTDLSNIVIDIPHYAEQNRIANFLSFIGKKTFNEKELLQQYKNQKKYLLQNLFI
ncbi:MAG: restriction endonuclease subunit S [Ferruginibacter sp.]